jgi:hypothetical protein
MKKISVSELRKTIKAAEAERLKLRLPFRPEGPKLNKSRKATETMMSRWMSDSGLDLAKLKILQSQRDAELLRLAGQHKKQALRHAARQKNKSAFTAQAKALADLAAGGLFPNPSITLDTPFLIWPTPSIALDSSAAPFSSSAKFSFSTSQDSGTQKVSFYFSWVNHFDDYAVIAATGSLSANGHLRAQAPWSLGGTASVVQIFAWLGLWFGVTSDLNAADYVTQQIAIEFALDGLFSGDVESKTISTGATLSKTMFAVPPGNVAVFEVALALTYENDGGNIEADFQSGNFQVTCPVVVVSLLNSPPGGPLVRA